MLTYVFVLVICPLIRTFAGKNKARTMNKKISVCAVTLASAMMLATTGCKGKVDKTAADTATEKTVETVETVEEKAVTDTVAAETVTEDKTDNAYPSTYDEPKGQVLEVLKDYNAHMTDYNATGVEALGMGFQRNTVLVNYTVSDISFDLKNKAKLKTQARSLIQAMPINEKVAWRCIPDEGHDLLVTLVGRQSCKIVSVLFTKEELKEMLE